MLPPCSAASRVGEQRGLELVRSMDLDDAARVPRPVEPATERAVFVLRRSGRVILWRLPLDNLDIEPQTFLL